MRRRIVVAGVVVTVAVAAAALANARRTPHIGRAGSKETRGGRPPGIGPPLSAYRVTYRLEERLTDTVRVNREKVWVRRPFDGRRETWSGRRRIRTEIWTLNRSMSVQANAAPAVSDQPPAGPGNDLRLDVSGPPAVGGRIAQRRERRQVGGRTCEVYRTHDRLVGAAITRPSAKTYTDSCVDHDGVLLEELQVRAGRRELRRLAISVDTRAVLDDSLFVVSGPKLDVPHGGGSTRPVDPSTTPIGDWWQMDAPPVGFIRVGRYAVVPPQPQNFTDPAQEGARRAGVADIYASGPDYVVVERGGTLHGLPPWTTDVSRPTVDTGVVGRAEVLLRGDGVELRVLTDGGHYVRVYGTLPLDGLAAVARDLHNVAGANNLKYLD